jgi:SEFIR domain
MVEVSAPKLFVSYSWTTQEHEEWVLNIATELRQSGVDVILDKWDLKEGDDANIFMEKMVTDDSVKKVLIISDKKYAEKADGRRGGVGTETQIISAKVYEKVEQSKFVVAVAERDENGKAFLPAYYTSRIYIDLSNDELYISNFDKLLRWIYDKPVHIKPELGKSPSFLENNEGISLATDTVFRRSVEAIKSSRSHAHRTVTEYFETFTSNLEKFRIESDEINIDYSDSLLKNIEIFLPYRNQVIELASTMSTYNVVDISSLLHHFFESLIPYMSTPEHIKSYRATDFDNYKFIIHEMLLYCVIILLQKERFQEVATLGQEHYFIEKDSVSMDATTASFTTFYQTLKSLESRNERMKLNRTSIHSDLLKERCVGTGISFDRLIQADFLLFITDSLQSIIYGKYQAWHPITSVYLGYTKTFKVFSKGESKRYFNKFKCIFDIERKEDFLPMIEAFMQGKLYVPKWNYFSLDFISLIGYEKLGTRT